MSTQTRSTTARMLRLGIGAFVLLLLGAGAITSACGLLFGWQTLFARPTDAKEAATLTALARQRLAQAQQISAAENGYVPLQHDLTHWSTGALFCVTSMANYASKEDSKPQDLSTATQVVLTFKRHALHEIEAAASRPAFVLPDSGANQSGTGRQSQILMKLDLIGKALFAYAEYCDAINKPARAVGPALAELSLGEHLAHSGPLPVGLIGLGMERDACRVLARTVPMKSLPAGTVKRVLRACLQVSADPRDLVTWTDETVACTVDSLKQFHAGSGSLAPDMTPPAAGTLETWLSRLTATHAAILVTNYYLQVRPFLARLDLDGVRATFAQNFPVPQKTMAYQIAPMYANALSRLLADRSQVGATTIIAALQSDYNDHSAFPASLSALVPRYVSKLPEDLASPTRAYQYTLRGNSYRLLSSSTLWSTGGHSSTKQYYPLATLPPLPPKLTIPEHGMGAVPGPLKPRPAVTK